MKIKKSESIIIVIPSEVVKIKNRARANHYEKYTGQKWEDPAHYDLVVNTAKIGIDTAVDLICNAVKKFFETAV